MYIPVAARGTEVGNCGTSSRKFEFIGVPTSLLISNIRNKDKLISAGTALAYSRYWFCFTDK